MFVYLVPKFIIFLLTFGTAIVYDQADASKRKSDATKLCEMEEEIFVVSTHFFL